MPRDTAIDGAKKKINAGGPPKKAWNQVSWWNKTKGELGVVPKVTPAQAKALAISFGLSESDLEGAEKGIAILASCTPQELVDKLCSADSCKDFLKDPGNRRWGV